jgi:hypothetical protein
MKCQSKNQIRVCERNNFEQHFLQGFQVFSQRMIPFFALSLFWRKTTDNQQEAFMFSATTLDFYTRTS